MTLGRWRADVGGNLSILLGERQLPSSFFSQQLSSVTGDPLFEIGALIVWVVGLFVTVWDFVVFQRFPIPAAITSLSGLSVSILGIIVIALGQALHRYAQRVLGTYFSYKLELKPGHQLMTQGVYGKIRHPAYLGLLLRNAGIPIIFHSVYGIAVMLLLVPLVLYRIHVEEAMLSKQFGESYRSYKRVTKKLIPYIF